MTKNKIVLTCFTKNSQNLIKLMIYFCCHVIVMNIVFVIYNFNLQNHPISENICDYIFGMKIEACNLVATTDFSLCKFFIFSPPSIKTLCTAYDRYTVEHFCYYYTTCLPCIMEVCILPDTISHDSIENIFLTYSNILLRIVRNHMYRLFDYTDYASLKKLQY